jgi:hypothetical protein
MTALRLVRFTFADAVARQQRPSQIQHDCSGERTKLLVPRITTWIREALVVFQLYKFKAEQQGAKKIDAQAKV